MKNQVGGLARALQVFQELGINVLHVEFHQTGGKHELVQFINEIILHFLQKQTLINLIQADVLVDIECDAKYLEHVIRLLKREVQSVNYASTIAGDDIPPATPLSKCGSFG